MLAAWFGCSLRGTDDLQSASEVASGGATGQGGVPSTVASGGSEDMCSPGEILCASECTDVSSDPSHCGACGFVCETSACSAGACELAEVSGLALHVAVNPGDDAVFFSATGVPGRVLRLDKAGGQPVLVNNSSLLTDFKLFVDGDHVYWSGFESGLVARVDKNVSGPTLPEVVWVPGSSAVTPGGVAGMGNYLAFAEQDTGQIHVVWKAPLMAPVQPYASLEASDPSDVACDGQTCVWAELSGGIRKWSSAEPEIVTTVATGQLGPAAVAVCGTNVYWVNADGSVQHTTLGSATDEYDVAWMDDAEPWEMACYGSEIYVTTVGPPGKLAALDAGRQVVLTQGTRNEQFGGVAVDGDAVFVVTADDRASSEGTARVLKVPRYPGGP